MNCTKLIYQVDILQIVQIVLHVMLEQKACLILHPMLLR